MRVARATRMLNNQMKLSAPYALWISKTDISGLRNCVTPNLSGYSRRGNLILPDSVLCGGRKHWGKAPRFFMFSTREDIPFDRNYKIKKIRS